MLKHASLVYQRKNYVTNKFYEMGLSELDKESIRKFSIILSKRFRFCPIK